MGSSSSAAHGAPRFGEESCNDRRPADHSMFWMDPSAPWMAASQEGWPRSAAMAAPPPEVERLSGSPVSSRRHGVCSRPSVMPTLEHNALVEMFREHPELAPHWLATLFHLEVPPHTSVGVVESSLDQLIPVEFRADLVIELRDANGVLVLAIVIEVQRDTDPDKKFSWPTYVTIVRAKKRCGTVVLVIAPDAGVAAWAAENIDLGLGLGHVEPLVLGPAVVPEITDPAEAEKDAELAVLSAVAHGNGPNGLTVVKSALVALGRLDQEHAMVYFQVIWSGLREPMRRALEALVMERQIEGETRFPFVQELMDRVKLAGLREGELKGLREGELKGLREGELKGKRDTLLRLLARAGIALTANEGARIHACADIAILDRWIDNVLGAKTATDVLS
ncbi:hypothetical protein WMF27_35295 [Sorangium sp. So ce281]|uniref:hypothetical protein n=1 Tax=unclassified Sorangium TaxID=2621164 RepID=UPI003F63A288